MSCSLAVAAMSMAAHADSVVYGAFSARAIVDSYAHETPSSPPIEAHFDQTITNSSSALSVIGTIGDTGDFGRITNWGDRHGEQYWTGFQEHAYTRLWTRATGPETLLYGYNRVEIERTFTILDGPGPEMLAQFIYERPATTATYAAGVNPTHMRGCEWYLERIGVGEIVSGSYISSGLQARQSTVYLSPPAMQPLVPGEYRMRMASWAEWEATAQNGQGWSDASIHFYMGVSPTPGAIVPLAGGLLFATRRRRQGLIPPLRIKSSQA